MKNFLEIKIFDKIYIQRTEFGKIQEFSLNNIILNTYEELPVNIKKCINLALDMETNPNKYFEYEESKNDIKITSVKDNPEIDKFIRIPETINGKPITSLGNYLLDQKIYKKIEQIQLPDTIKIFHDRCFASSENLKYINTPKSLTTISDSCFESCHSLKEFDASNITILGQKAFAFCESLKEININNVNALSADTFTDCINLETIKLSENITYIPYAFANHCEKLKNINLSDNISIIYENAFRNCKELNIEKMPEELKLIKINAFNGSGIKKFIAPKKLKKIDYCAFYNSALEYISIEKNIEVDRESFAQCSNLKEMKIYGKSTNKIEQER